MLKINRYILHGLWFSKYSFLGVFIIFLLKNKIYKYVDLTTNHSNKNIFLRFSSIFIIFLCMKSYLETKRKTSEWKFWTCDREGHTTWNSEETIINFNNNNNNNKVKKCNVELYNYLDIF